MSFLRHGRMLQHISQRGKAGKEPRLSGTCRRNRTRLSLGRLLSSKAGLRFTLVSEGIRFGTQN